MGRYSGGHFPLNSDEINRNEEFNAEMLGEYTVFVGLFSMNGPSLTGGHCTMGQLCQIFVSGRGLSSTNALMVVYGNDPIMCNLYAKRAIIIQSFENPTRVSQDAPHDVFDFGIPGDSAPGPDYRLCWASGPSQVVTV